MKNIKLIITLFLTILTFIGFSQKQTDKINPRDKNSFNIDYLDSLIELTVNKIRDENGLSKLKVDNTLRKKAKKNSVDCSNLEGFNAGHLNDDKETYEVVCMSNLLVNYGNPTYERLSELVVSILMNSPPHKKTILLKDTKFIGSGTIIMTKPNTILNMKTETTCFWTSIRFY